MRHWPPRNNSNNSHRKQYLRTRNHIGCTSLQQIKPSCDLLGSSLLKILQTCFQPHKDLRPIPQIPLDNMGPDSAGWELWQEAGTCRAVSMLHARRYGKLLRIPCLDANNRCVPVDTSHKPLLTVGGVVQQYEPLFPSWPNPMRHVPLYGMGSRKKNKTFLPLSLSLPHTIPE